MSFGARVNVLAVRELDLSISEDDFQQIVLDAARLLSWRAVHIRNVRTVDRRTGRPRWLAPYQGDGGLPDLILARRGRVLLVELKRESGRSTAEQRLWLAAAGAHGRLWRPSDWRAVLDELQAAA